VTDRLYYIITF